MKSFFIFLVIISTMTLVVAAPLPNLQPPANSISNASVLNVNNSQFLQGLTPAQVAALQTDRYNATYAALRTFILTNIAFTNNSQTFNNTNTFTGELRTSNNTFLNGTQLVINTTSSPSRIQIGIPRGASQFTGDQNRRNISLWIADQGNLTESFRISKTTPGTGTILPMQAYCLDYEGGIAFGTCFRWEMSRTMSGSDGQMCLVGYQMEASGSLSRYGTGMCITKTATPSNSIFMTFPGQLQNISISGKAHASAGLGFGDNPTGGLEIAREGPGFKAESLTQFIPYAYANDTVNSRTKLLIKQANACGTGTDCATDTFVGAINSNKNGEWCFGGDCNATNNTGTFFGNVNITNKGNLTIGGNINNIGSYYSNGVEGLTKNHRMLNSTSDACDMNYTGGILTASTC